MISDRGIQALSADIMGVHLSFFRPTFSPRANEHSYSYEFLNFLRELIPMTRRCEPSISVDFVHGLLVFLGDDLVGTVHGLTIFTSLEPPLNVFGRSLVQMVINMGESVLLDVGDTNVLVVVDLTLGGDKLTSQDVDKGRLASTIGSNDGNT